MARNRHPAIDEFDGSSHALIEHPAAGPRDKTFGPRTLLDWNLDLMLSDAGPAVAAPVSLTEAETPRLLHGGADYSVRTADVESSLSRLRTVAPGKYCRLRDSARQERYARSKLTPREHQLLEMVEPGLKNKERALESSIRPGTIKIHVKHIFENSCPMRGL
jgi:hypothetical protein